MIGTRMKVSWIFCIKFENIKSHGATLSMFLCVSCGSEGSGLEFGQLVDISLDIYNGCFSHFAVPV